MTKRQVIIGQLKEYFDAKGKVMTVDEYKAAEDAPIRLQALKRAVGSWSRIVSMIEKKAEPTKTVDDLAKEAFKNLAPQEEVAEEVPTEEKPKSATKAKGA